MTFIKNRKKTKGYTLIEIAAVIAILLALIGVLFIGVQGYLRGVNRANCVMYISNVQKAMRSYASMYGVAPGGALAITETRFVGTSGMIPSATANCSGGGTYTYATTVPATGSAYVSCSLSTEGHAPVNTTGW